MHFPLNLFIFFSSIGLFSVYYFQVVSSKPILYHAKNDFHELVKENCPIFFKKYYPTFWCFNNHMMLILLVVRELFSKFYTFDLVEEIKMKDGGITGLSWSGLDYQKHNLLSIVVKSNRRNFKKEFKSAMEKRSTPIAIIFHTITGDDQAVQNIVRYVHNELKWTCVVCVRRGHGNLPLATPNVNTMGSSSDLRNQIEFIRLKFPQSPLYAIGISAGSGLLAKYLGEFEDNTYLTAAVAVSPAYDIEKAFHRVKPMYQKPMRKRLVTYFLDRHSSILSSLDGFAYAKNSLTMGEFQDRSFEMAGFSTKEDYYLSCNPIHYVDKIKIPLLILNAEDDPICVNINVMENLYRLEHIPRTMVVYTKRGSHVSYLEGIFAKSWSNRVVKEYFLAIQKISIKENSRKNKSKLKKSSYSLSSMTSM